LIGVAVVAYSLEDGYPLFHPILVIWATAWVGFMYLVFLRRLASKGWAAGVLLPTPVVLLGALAINCALYGATTLCADRSLIWSFPAEDKGNVFAGPLVAGERVYVTVAMNGGGGDRRWGILYCLDKVTGEKVWSFTNDRQMKPAQGTPCLASGRLYFGEGLLDSRECRFYCLEAATGQKLWDFRIGSHSAGDAVVRDGRIFFAAGAEGIYCLDAVTGAKLWQFDQVQVDAGPAVVGRQLYAGGIREGRHEAFCLDTATGHLLWRVPVSFPVQAVAPFASESVFFSLGTGSLTRSADRPAGAVLCLEAQSGKSVWRYEVADGVLSRPAVDEKRVYFGSRDGCCYTVDRRKGKLFWKKDLGSPIVTAPALAGARLYVAASGGPVFSLDAATGEAKGSYDVAKYTRAKPWLFSSPVAADGRLYFGAGLDDLIGGMVPRLYCLKDDLANP
jgi:hypothetical protein